MASPQPHGGGSILSGGVSSVLIEGLAAAVQGATCSCPGAPNSVTGGSLSVFFGGRPAARMGDGTAHGGFVSGGCATVLVGG